MAEVVGLGAFDDEFISVQLLAGSIQICETVSVPEFGKVICQVAPGIHTA